MKPIKVLTNANDVLRVLSEEGPLTPAELAERLAIPRPSVYRLLDGLHAVGLTEALPNSSAGLGLRWLHLADRAQESMVEWRGASDVLADLVAQTRQTAYLSVPRGDEAVCVAWEQGRGIGVLVWRPGRSLPLFAGAAGRTLLAFSADLDRYLLTSTRRPLTSRTLITEEQLREDAAQTRARGYAVSDQDVTEGVGALGAPIMDGTSVRGALSLAGRATEIRERRSEFADALRAACETLRGSLALTTQAHKADISSVE